jgi:RNA polymerase sigma-70 factor (ECF subfamily)
MRQGADFPHPSLFHILHEGNQFMSSTTTLTTESDATLIASALRGDRNEYGKLIRRYESRLLAGLIQKTGSSVDAEDIMQEAFLQAYLKLEAFRGESTFFTWLFRIALNLLVTKRRRKHRETPFADAPQIVGEQAMNDRESPSAQLLQKENQQQVLLALSRLSEEHRTVLLLREYEGHDYETIAELLNTKVGTIRSRVHRARHALREEILLLSYSA